MSYNCWTSSKTHAEFCKWASQAKGAGNEAFTSSTAISRAGRICGIVHDEPS
jgi:hypothetical protein